MFNYRDFAPKQVQRSGFFKKASWEHFEDAMKEANEWVEHKGVKVINIETVVLPNVWSNEEEGPEDAELQTFASSYWYQVLRVWYKE